MFKQMIWSCAFVLAVVPVSGHCTGRAYAIEPGRTVVSFEVGNLGVAKRHGLFTEVSGTISLDPQSGRGSVDIVVNARSIHTSDAGTQAFVQGSSFLNVARYSEIAYRAEQIVFADGKPSRIEGKLTLLGVTRDVSLLVSEYECDPQGGSCVLDAAASFRRSEFGMNQYLAFVSDNVRLSIHGVTTGLGANPLTPLQAIAGQPQSSASSSSALAAISIANSVESSAPEAVFAMPIRPNGTRARR